MVYPNDRSYMYTTTAMTVMIATTTTLRK